MTRPWPPFKWTLQQPIAMIYKQLQLRRFFPSFIWWGVHNGCVQSANNELILPDHIKTQLFPRKNIATIGFSKSCFFKNFFCAYFCLKTIEQKLGHFSLPFLKRLKEISDFPPSLRTLSLLAFRPKSLLRFDMVFASVTLYFDFTGISRKTAINW